MGLPLPVLLITVVAVGCVSVALVAFLPMLFMSLSATNKMGEELIDSSTRSSTNDVAANIGYAVSFTDVLDLIIDRVGDTIDERKMMKAMMALLPMLYPKGFNYLIIGTEKGYFFGLERSTDDAKWTWRVKNSTYPCRTSFNLPNMGDATNITEIPTGEVSCSYDPRKRSWYPALNKSHVAIAPAYPHSNGPELALTLGKQMLSADGRVIGLATVDSSGSSHSQVLHRGIYGRTGGAFMLEIPSLTTIASSSLHPLLFNYNNSDIVKATGVVTPISKLDMPEAKIALKVAGDLVLSNNSDMMSVRVKKDGYWVSIQDISATPEMHWRLVIVVPVSDYFSEVNKSRNLTIGIVVGIIVLIISVTLGILPLIMRPLTSLRDRVRGATQLEFGDKTRKRGIISEIDHLEDQVEALSNAMVSFTKYIPKEVVKDMLAAGRGVAELGMEPAHLCVMFSDIAKFTSICESVTPKDLSYLLNAYFSRCVGILVRHNATVDKFIGDAIMAFWGAPIPNENAEMWACLASLHMQAEIEKKVQPIFAKFGQALQVRTGVHSGECLVGNIGSSDRLSYTALGDTVNVASRLEGCNKIFGSRILISSVTREFVSENNFLLRFVGKVRVVGREAPLPVYEVHCVLSDVIDSSCAFDSNRALGGVELAAGEVTSVYSMHSPNSRSLPGFDTLVTSGHSPNNNNNNDIASQLSMYPLPLGGRGRGGSMSNLTNQKDVTSSLNTQVAVAAIRRGRGAFENIQDALREVRKCQTQVSKLQRSAIKLFGQAMAKYQRGPEAMNEALDLFLRCKEAVLASNAEPKYPFGEVTGPNAEAHNLASHSPIHMPSLAHMLDACSSGVWSEVISQDEK